MKKLSCVLPLVVIGLLAASCANKKKNEFADKMATYIKANQTDSVMENYPDARFDSVAFNGDFEKIEIEKTETPDVTRAKFGEVAYIDFVEKEDGTFQIVSSKGVAAFPEGKLDLARKTGMIKDDMTDSELARLLADEEFFTWLAESQKKQLADLLQITNSKTQFLRGLGEGASNYRMTVTILNNTPVDIKGSDYKIEYRVGHASFLGSVYPDTYTTGGKEGIDIKAGETATATITQNNVSSVGKPKIAWNLPPEELAKFLNFSGGEYGEYLKTK